MKLARGLCYKRRDVDRPQGRLFDARRSVDYNLWCGPARMLPVTRQKFHYDWHWQREWGNGDMGNQGPHQMDIARWGLGSIAWPTRVIGYGGRLGYEDAGDVANTQVGIFEFGDKTLVFEVRGLETDRLRGRQGRRDLLRHRGLRRPDQLHRRARPSIPAARSSQKFKGGGDHFGNFVDAVRSRNPEDLTADILEGHLSAALAHTGNISYRLGKTISLADLKQELAKLESNENAVDTLERTSPTCRRTSVDLDNTKLALGPMLRSTPRPRRSSATRSQRDAHPRLPQAVRRPGGRRSLTATIGPSWLCHDGRVAAVDSTPPPARGRGAGGEGVWRPTRSPVL